MIDRKITTKELEEKGLVVDNVEIVPKLAEKTMSPIRSKRHVPYYLIAGKVYYQESELLDWIKSTKRESIIK